MGWFLTRKKKTSRSTRRRSRKPSRDGRWDPKRTLLGVKVLGGLALGLAAVIGARAADKALVDYASDRHAAVVTADRVELVDAPAWMTRGTRARIAQTAADRLSHDPMNRRSVEIAALALNEQPWVKRVRQVRRLGGGKVRVSADYRRPVAMVQGRDGYHLVDVEAVCLPGLYASHQVDRVGLPLITGVSSPAPSRPGQVWPGDDLRAGIDLVQLIAPEPYARQVQRYDVSHRDARGRIRLVLYTGGGMVRWGLPPRTTHAVEPTPQTKLAWLRHVDTERGGIDAGGKIVDIYGPRIAINQPALWATQHPNTLTSHR